MIFFFFFFLSGPSSPRNVQALPLSVSAIQVRWQPPDDPNGGIIKYIIEYQTVGQGSPHPWVDTDDGVKTSKDVTALNGSTLYQFRVRASSKVPGEWSNFVQAMTQGDGEQEHCLQSSQLCRLSLFSSVFNSYIFSSLPKRPRNLNPNH